MKNTIKNNLFNVRKEKGLTLNFIAKKTKISASGVRYIEKGNFNTALFKYIEVLLNMGVTLEEIFLKDFDDGEGGKEK